MVKKIISHEDISIPEALKILEEVLKDETYADSFIYSVLDYLRKFSKVDYESAKTLIKELIEKFGLSRITAIQVVNIMPESVEELRVILGIEKREFREEELNEILQLLNQYRKKK